MVWRTSLAQSKRRDMYSPVEKITTEDAHARGLVEHENGPVLVKSMPYDGDLPLAFAPGDIPPGCVAYAAGRKHREHIRGGKFDFVPVVFYRLPRPHD